VEASVRSTTAATRNQPPRRALGRLPPLVGAEARSAVRSRAVNGHGLWPFDKSGRRRGGCRGIGDFRDRDERQRAVWRARWLPLSQGGQLPGSDLDLSGFRSSVREVAIAALLGRWFGRGGHLTRAFFGRRVRRVVLFAVALSAVVGGAASATIPGANRVYTAVSHGDAKDLFYTTSGAGAGLPNGAEIFAIAVSGAKVTTRDIGPTHGGDCGSLARSPKGTLYSICGALFGAQQLATINQKTGRAHLFGVPVFGLAVMAMAFGRNGTLYAVGGCNPDPTTFECTPDSDPTYNSLYKINKNTGAFTRIGSTGAPQLFMDLTFDRHGHMLGVTTTVNPSAAPAILYRINPSTGKARKLFNLVGSNYVMGLALRRDGKLYATDNFPHSGLYLIDPKTGFETAIAALPFGASSDLVSMNTRGFAASSPGQ
jgi:hypothetical protein